MGTIHGKNANIYLQGSGSDAVPITEANEWTMDLDYDLEEDPAFGDTWKTNVQGLFFGSGTILSNFDTAQATLFDAFLAGSSRKMYVYPDRGSTGRYYYGTVWPKVGVSVPMGVAKSTVNWTADGPITMK